MRTNRNFRFPTLIVTLLFSLVLLAGCGLIPSADYGVRQLQNADTLEEEGAAMKYLAENTNDLNFTPYDNLGNIIDMTQPEWWFALNYIVLRADENTIEHRMIMSTNIFYLLGEGGQ